MRLLHRQTKQMVRRAFIDKALTVLIDREESGLGSVHHKMWKHRLRAIGPPPQGHRCPKGRTEILSAPLRPQTQGQILRRPRVPGGCWTPLGGYLWQMFSTVIGVAIEAPTGKNHPTAHDHIAHLPILRQTHMRSSACNGGGSQTHNFCIESKTSFIQKRQRV